MLKSYLEKVFETGQKEKGKRGYNLLERGRSK